MQLPDKIGNHRHKNTADEAEEHACCNFILHNVHFLELEIVAYFSIGVKPILIDEKKHVLSKQQKKDMKLEVINKEDKRHEVISTFLIGQIARNDKFDKSTIGLEEILGQVFNKINEVVKIIGGKIILIEVDNNPILVKHYEKFGFKIIKDGSNDELTQLMKFNGR